MKQIYDFNALLSPQDGLRYLETATRIDSHPEDRGLILLDFYYYNLSFAKDQSFTPEQTSVFFSIMKETFYNSIASPFIHLQKDYQFFQDLLLQHCIHRPPYSQKLFSFKEMKVVNEYAATTFFRHYLMYKYAFTKKMRLDFTAESAAEAAEAERAVQEAAAGGGQILKGGDLEKPVEGALPQPSEAKEETPSTTRPSQPPPSEPSKPEPAMTPAVPEEQQPPQPPAPEKPAAAEPAPETPRLTPQEIAAQELKHLVQQTLGTKLDELRTALMTKMQTQEDQLLGKLRRLEDKDGGDEKGGKGAAAGGAKEKGKKK
ncbi:hypothetical protein HDV00_006396 [Rhizophlyctis rosea]|nr:hypothetical protein HDV00_006396 [Rhizophlyctis rosea]